MAVTITEIETALFDLWSGKVLTTLDKGPVPVAVFVDRPDPEEFPEREFPSISIMMSDMLWESAVEDSEDRVAIATNTTAVPYITTMQRNAVWYRISFNIHGWSLDAAADRDLTRWIDSRLLPRDAINVNVSGEPDPVPYWIFRTGFNVADEVDKDKVRYHKVWSFEVLADINNEDTDEQVKAVHEIRLQTGLIETLMKDQYAGKDRVQLADVGGLPPNPSERFATVPVDASGQQVSAKDAKYVKHRVLAFNETDYWFPS